LAGAPFFHPFLAGELERVKKEAIFNTGSSSFPILVSSRPPKRGESVLEETVRFEKIHVDRKSPVRTASALPSGCDKQNGRCHNAGRREAAGRLIEARSNRRFIVDRCPK
jgi:hypothetical protein